MTWDWSYALQTLPALLGGVLTTLVVTVLCAGIALLLGLALAVLFKLLPSGVGFVLRLPIELIKTLPALVILFFGFYGLPQVGITLPALPLGVIVLGTIYAAYCFEVYRGGFESIPQGMRDAAHALGLSRFTTWSRILVPMVVRASMPALLNYVLVLYRQSALLFAIGVPVILTAAQVVGYQYFRYLEPYTLAGVIYLVSNIPLAIFLRRYEKRNRNAHV